MTSPVYVQTRSPQNSVAIKRMHKQCVPGALSPPPPRLGTRLGREAEPEEVYMSCKSTIVKCGCYPVFVQYCE